MFVSLTNPIFFKRPFDLGFIELGDLRGHLQTNNHLCPIAQILDDVKLHDVLQTFEENTTNITVESAKYVTGCRNSRGRNVPED
jgi:hypothetical protein